jgi:hypothetical protein
LELQLSDPVASIEVSVFSETRMPPAGSHSGKPRWSIAGAFAERGGLNCAFAPDLDAREDAAREQVAPATARVAMTAKVFRCIVSLHPREVEPRPVHLPSTPAGPIQGTRSPKESTLEHRNQGWK